MAKKIGKVDPKRLRKAKQLAPTDPLAPEVLEAVRELFKPDEYEQYVKEWTARLARKPDQESA